MSKETFIEFLRDVVDGEHDNLDVADVSITDDGLSVMMIDGTTFSVVVTEV